MSSYKSRKSGPTQRTIASFFGAKPEKEREPILLDTPKKKPVNTPERLINAQQPKSRISQPRGAFDEFASSDTSFGSPEVTNFRNPLLARVLSSLGLPEMKKTTETLFVADISDDEKENQSLTLSSKPSMKRAASSNVFELLDGKPRKVAKRAAGSSFTLLTSPSVPAFAGAITLSEEQKTIIDTVVNKGENLFFTGSAGTGKSVVLRQLVQELFRKHSPLYVGVTASTGLAACNIKGQTIHKFLSIGLGTGSPQDLALKIKRNGAAKKKWKTLRVLVVDEILMIDGKLFSKLDQVAQIIRENRKPFGGIQIVCSGDFFQLPPVSKENASQYCFQSPSWSKTMKHTIILTKVFRQQGDNDLIDMLNALRHGSLDPHMISMFQGLLRKVDYSDGIAPTELFPTRQEVKRANEMRLHQLPGKMYSYRANDSDKNPALQRLFDNLMCEQILDLKVGAQVMYLKNTVDSNVVNGSIGTVVSFIAEDLFMKIFAQFHPSDFINVSPAFLEVLRLLSGLIGCVQFSPEQQELFNNIPEQWKDKVSYLANDAFRTPANSELLPLVNFKTSSDFTLILVKREEFSVDQGRMPNFPGSAMVDSLTRQQLPLLLAWAMSIHKAQGQSIDRLRVDLRRTFEKGQIYVALSRATNKEHLEVFNFDHRRVTVSNEVREFYKTLTFAAT
ncbi:hypothetical protein PUMCH_004524 [Australozyma saopauloensis]|uniref:ATP-dependent DNA helicase PIF1 n=1 Tax=Australozyma saopauloensis TaxID=291208 RepID=A0AAX4HF17_9ASCO|nr:hypothetical protein PUMCH_004524 [[Candida] saopauloensis]